MTKKHQIPSTDSLFLRHMIGARDEKNALVLLLEEIHASGSINRAAKTVGMSYKAAWERIETLNNLSPHPLISRQVGGSGGGGTVLTEAGHDFLKRANLLQREFTSFLNYFYFSPEEAFNTLKTLRRIEMKISARNVWLGNVAKIERGAVNSVVTVALKGRDTIVSVITENSVQRLGLQSGTEVLAIVKAPSVMLALEVDRQKISARNILEGQVNRIIPGVVNDEVIIDLDAGNTVTSILTSQSVKRLGLVEGMKIAAIIKASDVLLAIA
ncbi:MAG: TOBE domain-containing protein [Desulfocapsaceae bacterium]|nr:TOBE domain-containing protein [Desulfocapsaceae bacterium]